MFVRKKYVKGNPYGYLVENEWTFSGSRQKVVSYLGRIIEVSEKSRGSFTGSDDILRDVILYEIPSEFTYQNKSIISSSGKSVCLGLNGGVLCQQTIEHIFLACSVSDEKRPGFALANALKNAGLRLSPKDFISLYLAKEMYL